MSSEVFGAKSMFKSNISTARRANLMYIPVKMEVHSRTSQSEEKLDLNVGFVPDKHFIILCRKLMRIPEYSTGWIP